MSLHPVSRKMFVQLIEAHSQGNIQNLGLLPGVYVPDADAALRRQSWAGLNASRLRLGLVFHGSRCGPGLQNGILKQGLALGIKMPTVVLGQRHGGMPGKEHMAHTL